MVRANARPGGGRKKPRQGAQRTGRGQVVDAAIVDGTTHLLASPLAKLARGAWTDERGVNQLDGGWPFYAVYATSDGRYMAVGALEAKFYRQLIELLDLDADPERQHDRSTWPELRSQLAQRFAERTRDEWAALFEGTDACVAPVLSLAEAPAHPHNVARGIFAPYRDGVAPRIAPVFSRTPTLPPGEVHAAGQDTREVLLAAGFGEAEVDALLAQGVIAQA